ncbi:hypothetical protein K4L06_08345 [Lysobacter sp. BMK333-48F3]|uniref:hypothetical protein n=1 Tax=Lysobacter sp. BMK333-48F3 TaxID=2867962 RepID=UPI001C8CADB3|nr:hypothetical protein [Lysobacter sp. BMK333-48F3]MBX9401323.1 hypothetical protein [Lysobacter sp. BMK333-48F3]
MGEFLTTIFSLPTAFYTVLLGVVIGYWLLSALGLVGGEMIDGWIGGDGHGHGGPGLGDHTLADGAHHHQQGLFDPLMRLGLGGIPVTVVLSVLIGVSWALTYLADVYLLRHLPGVVAQIVGGVAAILVAFALAIPVSALALRPLRRLLRKMQPGPARPILGQVAVVRSPVNAVTGTASMEDGGAGLILQIRDDDPARFQRGDRVVLIEYLEGQNAYRVVSEDEFRGA